MGVAQTQDPKIRSHRLHGQPARCPKHIQLQRPTLYCAFGRNVTSCDIKAWNGEAFLEQTSFSHQVWQAVVSPFLLPAERLQGVLTGSLLDISLAVWQAGGE